MNNDTQPLAPEQVAPEIVEYAKKLHAEWNQEAIRHGADPARLTTSWEEVHSEFKKRFYEQAKQPSAEQERAAVDAREALQEAYERIHIHGPFIFLLNQNHNALRGCVTCGQAWVGMMAGSPDDIRWHCVAEPPEEETL